MLELRKTLSGGDLSEARLETGRVVLLTDDVPVNVSGYEGEIEVSLATELPQYLN